MRCDEALDIVAPASSARPTTSNRHVGDARSGWQATRHADEKVVGYRRIKIDKEEMMIRTLTIAAASAAVLALSPTAFAQQTGGTADEAKAMLMKAVAAVKADKAKALDMFNKGEGGFRDRDLYVFCDSLKDFKVVAIGNPNARQLIGTDARTTKDATGKVFGPDLVAGMQKPEGEITEVSYMFPRPGADKTPVQKVSLVTRASDDLGCGVGYYK
jgi:hypothetical protein